MAKKTFLIYLILHVSCLLGEEYDLYKKIPKNGALLEPKPMPNIHRNLILLKEDCGQVCDTSDRYLKKAGKYFDIIEKNFECPYLFDHFLDPPLLQEQLIAKHYQKSGKQMVPPDVYEVPPEILEMYLFERRVPVNYLHIDDSDWTKDEDKNEPWNESMIEQLFIKIKNKSLIGGYGVQESLNIENAIKDHMLPQVKDGHVLVIGSQTPWIEAILLYHGAAKVTTLEYSKIISQHPKLEILTPKNLRDLVLEGKPPSFDAMVTFSSLEHSGLGRYGDPLNPWGDLITMAQTWCLMKPGGRALVGVPSGMDQVLFNTNRLYGPIMSAHLYANWNQIYSTYKDFGPQGTHQNASKFCPTESHALDYCFQPITIVEKPSSKKNSEL